MPTAEQMRQYRATHPEYYEKEKIASKERMKSKYTTDESYRLRKLQELALYRQSKKELKANPIVV